MFRCKSGRHLWTFADDAVKCCNGFHLDRREWSRGTPGVETAEDGRIRWFADEPGHEYWWGAGREHDATYQPEVAT